MGRFKVQSRIEYCLTCGRVFQAGYTRLKYPVCSDSCRDVLFAKRHCRLCSYCGIGYISQAKVSAYCSPHCASLARRGKKVLRAACPGRSKRIVVHCWYCYAMKVVSRAHYKQNVGAGRGFFCDPGCLGAFRAKWRKCAVCGRSTRNKTYCSSECSWEGFKASRSIGAKVDLVCDDCGKGFERPLSKHRANKKRGYALTFCSPECNRNYAKRHGKNGESPYKLSSRLRWSVLERDNFRCVYCGCSSRDGSELHVDHIIPRSRDGQDVMENLITSCVECNLGKSDRLLKYESRVQLSLL